MKDREGIEELRNLGIGSQRSEVGDQGFFTAETQSTQRSSFVKIVVRGDNFKTKLSK